MMSTNTPYLRPRSRGGGGAGVAKSRRNALRTLRRRDTVGVILLGDCGVGKSALVNRWIRNYFLDKYKPTVEDFQMKSYRYMGQSINVGIIDMTGSWDFPAMIDLYLTRVDSIMFTYDVGCTKSIQNLHHLYDRLLKIRGENHGVLLTVVGTKIDKCKDAGDDFQNNDLDAFLIKIGGSCKHVLTSAKLDINVNEAFENALDEVIAHMIPDEEAIKRLGELIRKNEQSDSWKKRFCCFL